jgi:UDP-glucose 4-epimerase
MKTKVRNVFEGKTVLVTGGAGAIGSNLTRTLSELKTKKIIILDDLSSSYEWNIPVSPKIQFIKGNVLDDEKLKWAFKAKPEFVYHLAAHFANQNSVDSPETDLMVNGLGTLKVLEYSQLVDVERFVYASSGCGMYGPGCKIPFEEHDISMKFHTPYQVTKTLGEMYTNYFFDLYGLPVVNARFFNSYGPGEVPGKYRNVIPNFFWWAMNKQPLPITGTGEETRDFTYVGDIVSVLLAMADCEAAVGEAFNIGTSREIRVIDLAKWVNEMTGNKAGIVFREKRDWDKKNRLLASIEKAHRVLGYSPQMDFREGLKHVHSWFVANQDSIRASCSF